MMNYNFPTGWTQCNLTDICSIRTGKYDANHAVENGKYRFYTCSSTYSFCNTRSFEGECIIVPGNGDIGQVYYYDGVLEAYQRTYVLEKIRILPKYLYYHLFWNWRHINSDKQYGSTIRYVRIGNFEKYIVSLPPLPEQHRIVTKIDSLFSELDNGVALLKTIKAQLRFYRQAVLRDVFNCFSELSTIMKITSLVTSGSRGWAEYYSDNGAKFIRIGNLTRDGIKIDLTDVQCVTLPEKVEGARSLLMEGDVLISITADLGSIGFVETDFGEAYINQHIALVRFRNKVQSKFYAWFLRSDKGQVELLKNKRGAGKLGLGLDDIRNAKIPIVTDEEALYVLQKIESRLSVCDKLEQTIDQTLALSASLRQSILKKAFEGRLVPQDPDDEPAEKLLERIQAEKAAVLTKQKQTRKRVNE